MNLVSTKVLTLTHISAEQEVSIQQGDPPPG